MALIRGRLRWPEVACAPRGLRGRGSQPSGYLQTGPTPLPGCLLAMWVGGKLGLQTVWIPPGRGDGGGCTQTAGERGARS